MSTDITKFTYDMNIIGSLADQPAITTVALKQKFDEGGKAIKEYLNDSLITDMNTMEDNIINETNTAINNAKTELTEALNDTKTELEGEMSDLKEEIEGEMSDLEGDLTTKIDNITTILNGAFIIWNITQTFKGDGTNGNFDKTHPFTCPTGYVFGGVINTKYRPNRDDAKNFDVRAWNMPGDTGTINVHVLFTTNDAGTVYGGYSVLWIKSGLATFTHIDKGTW